MENHNFNGKIHYKWQFSIAMLNYQRVFHGNPNITWMITGVPPWRIGNHKISPENRGFGLLESQKGDGINEVSPESESFSALDNSEVKHLCSRLMHLRLDPITIPESRYHMKRHMNTIWFHTIHAQNNQFSVACEVSLDAYKEEAVKRCRWLSMTRFVFPKGAQNTSEKWKWGHHYLLYTISRKCNHSVSCLGVPKCQWRISHESLVNIN